MSTTTTRRPAHRSTTKPADPKATARSGNFDRILNVVPSTGTETDWDCGDALAAGLLTATRRPREVDLRADWWGVGDQGRTGSCVGWATADGVGRYVLKTAGRIGENDRVSPRFIWMSSKETDEFVNRPTSFVEGSGTSLKAAMDVARKFGYAMETELPFDIETTMYLGNENALFASAAQRRISYVNLHQELDRWRDWVAQNGPMLVGLSVDSNWMNLGRTGKLDAYDRTQIFGGHAVCVAGYRGDGSFIIRNSWGTGWGDEGFAYVTPDYIKAAFYPESYGAVVA